MHKKIPFIIILIMVVFNVPKNVWAYSASDYEYRNLCASYEVASFASDGSITKVSCHSNYNEAKNFMKNDGRDELGILTWVNGRVKLIDTNDNEVTTYLNLTSNYHLHPMISGWYTENGKNGIYVVIAERQ